MTVFFQPMRVYPMRRAITAPRLYQTIPPGPVRSLFGGHSYILGKGEIRFRLSENLTLNSFLESGNLWYRLPSTDNFSLRLGLGVGLSYTTPVGPLALSVGFNPFRKQQYLESLYEFHISIGQF